MRGGRLTSCVGRLGDVLGMSALVVFGRMGCRSAVIGVAASVVVSGCGVAVTPVERVLGNLQPEGVPTVVIVDGSASMTEADAPGPRIDAAKAAARGLVAALPDATTIALQTYGTTTGSAPEDKPAGCQDVTPLIPLQPLDRATMNTAIDAITPSGYTPISLALRTAANQLPADNTPQAIVLVSDGEETCDVPPCDTAADLKRTHPALTISAVGFKVDGPASDQLRCIAETTGGIFLQADNADQLAARLLATRNIDQANSSLSSTGIGGVELGTTIVDIRAKNPDYPDAATTGTVTVVWRNCDFTFTNGTLTSIAPHDGGRTIDGITAGSPVSTATNLYGAPIDKQIEGSRGILTFTADQEASTAYKMTVEGYAEVGGTTSGTVTSIILCICAPRAGTDPTRPAGITDDVIRSMTFPPGTCGDDSRGWNNTAPITLRNGEGEARDPSGEFAGASIRDAALVGWVDADGNGTEDAVVSFVCFGSTFEMCCAGRSSMLEFIRVFDFSTPSSPRPVGETIMPGSSPVRGETYVEPRYIDQARVDGSAILTEEKLIYPENSGPLDHSPDATIEVAHRFTDGRWTSTERVVS